MKKQVIYELDSGDGQTTHYIAQVDEFSVNNTKLRLRHANSNEWAKEYRGKTICKLKDNGDGIIVSFGKGQEIYLDYSQVEELRMLLHFQNVDAERVATGNKPRFVTKLKKYKEFK